MSFLDRAIVKAYERRASAPGTRRTVSEDEAAHLPAPVTAAGPERESPIEVRREALPTSEAKPIAERPRRFERAKSGHLTWSWPRIVQQLLNQAEYGFLHLAHQLWTATEGKPRKVIAFVSSAQGDGCTSVMLTIARILSRRKEKRTLIVEGNVGHPSHLELLNLEGAAVRELRGANRRLAVPDEPWDLGGESLSLVPLSIQNNILPGDTDRQEWEQAVRRGMDAWRSQYDLILIDCGPVAGSRDVGQLWWSGLADRVVTIASSSRLATDPRGFVDDVAWEQAGIEPMGVIETFA